MSKILKLLSIQPYLRFYEIMNYPVPKNAELFFQYSDIEHTNANKMLKNIDVNESESWDEFSRDKKSEYMDEYLEEINRLKSTFQSIPFVEQIFLCNSISFNALDKNSDIDLFIIAEPGRIRTAKFRSMVLFTLKWAKRFWKKLGKKSVFHFSSHLIHKIYIQSLYLLLIYI